MFASTGPILVRSREVKAFVESLPAFADCVPVAASQHPEAGSWKPEHYARLAELFELGGVAVPQGIEDQISSGTAGHVLIVGDAEWVPALAEELALSGIANLSFWFGEAPASSDAVARAFDLELLCRRIENISPGCTARTAHGLFLSPDTSLVVGALAPSRTRRQVELERACRSNGIPFLGAEIVGTKGCVGPISVASEAGCWLCARQRRQAHYAEPEAAARADRLAIANYPPLTREVARSFGHSVAEDVRRYLRTAREKLSPSHIRIVDIARQTSTRHGLVPMPFCETCGRNAVSAPLLDLADISGNPDEQVIRAVFRDWIDPETGPIIGPILRESASSRRRTFVAVAEVAPFCAFGDCPAPKEPACGKGLSPGEAMLGAIGEAFERYAASRCDPGDLVYARMADLRGDVLDPRLVGLYDTEQYATESFPFPPFDSDAQHVWRSATILRTGTPAWVLAGQTYYRFPPGFSDFVAQVTTSGLAAGMDFESTAMRAVLELVERDAVMVAWLCRDPGQLLPLEMCDCETRSIAEELSSWGAEVGLHLFRGAGGIPVVMCAAMGDGKSWPGLAATAAAHPDIQRAARGALLEQAVSGLGMKKMLHDGSGPRPLRPEDVRCGQFLDHACFYLPDRPEELEFLRYAPLYVPDAGRQAEPISRLAELTARLAQDEIEVAVVNLAPRDVASASIHVVRAVATGLQPLSCGFGMEFRGSQRFRERPGKSLNPAPHPFC